MSVVVEFMNELFEDMDGTDWHITAMEEFKEVTQDGVVYAKLADGSMYEKQDNIYIYQTTGYLGDDYSGTIIKPITDTIALVMGYTC